MFYLKKNSYLPTVLFNSFLLFLPTEAQIREPKEMCQEGLSRLALSSCSKQTECSLGERRTLAAAPELMDSILESRRHPSGSLQKEFPQVF